MSVPKTDQVETVKKIFNCHQEIEQCFPELSLPVLLITFVLDSGTGNSLSVTKKFNSAFLNWTELPFSLL